MSPKRTRKKAACPEDEDDKEKDKDDEKIRRRRDERIRTKSPWVTAQSVTWWQKPKAEATADANRAFAATREAMRIVEPVYGHVNGDSADDIYQAVLKQEKVDLNGVHPSAFKALVQMAISRKNATTNPLGDSAVSTATEADFKEFF